MKASAVHISPAAAKMICALPAGLKNKVKNALREISCGQEWGTAVHVKTVLKGTLLETPTPPELSLSKPFSVLRLYKAGRFRILFRRNNGSVWVDALALEPIQKFALEERRFAL